MKTMITMTTMVPMPIYMGDFLRSNGCSLHCYPGQGMQTGSRQSAGHLVAAPAPAVTMAPGCGRPAPGIAWVVLPGGPGAAVDGDDLAGDVPGGRGGEEVHRTGNVVRIARPAVAGRGDQRRPALVG